MSTPTVSVISASFIQEAQSLPTCTRQLPSPLLCQGLDPYNIYFLEMLFSVKMLIHSLQKRSFVTPILEKKLLKNVKLTPIS